MLKLPLFDQPDVTYTTRINGERYRFTVYSNTRIDGMYTLSIDPPNRNPIYGVVLNPGIDIIKQFNLGIGQLWVIDLANPSSNVSDDSELSLYLLTDDEVDSLNV